MTRGVECNELNEYALPTNIQYWGVVSVIEFASPTVQALAVVALVTVEAIVLYTGYGVLERLAGPSVIERIEKA